MQCVRLFSVLIIRDIVDFTFVPARFAPAYLGRLVSCLPKALRDKCSRLTPFQSQFIRG